MTLLFTDIEGSTRLLHALGPGPYAEALAEHRRIVREAAAAHGGVEVDTQGDAFFIAFPTPGGAAEAAQGARDGLAAGVIRVRMGLHTGTPAATDEGYVGEDVHRGARIAALAHGDQILVSPATAALLDAEPLRDLGRHRLKDFDGAVRVFQLGDREFPPLRTPGTLFSLALLASLEAEAGRADRAGRAVGRHRDRGSRVRPVGHWDERARRGSRRSVIRPVTRIRAGALRGPVAVARGSRRVRARRLDGRFGSRGRLEAVETMVGAEVDDLAVAF